MIIIQSISEISIIVKTLMAVFYICFCLLMSDKRFLNKHSSENFKTNSKEIQIFTGKKS